MQFFHIILYFELNFLMVIDGLAPDYVNSFNVLHHLHFTQFFDIISDNPLSHNHNFSIAKHALSQQLLNTLGLNFLGYSSHCIFTNSLRESVSSLLQSSIEPNKVEYIHAKLLE
jgi:hypothetical protein